MFKKIFAISFVIVLSLLTGRELFTGIWFWVNQAEITELFCINKKKPELECNGKCHLKKTLETESGDFSGFPGLPSFEERFDIQALPVVEALNDQTSLPSTEVLPWHYQFDYDFSPSVFVFHPPKV